MSLCIVDFDQSRQISRNRDLKVYVFKMYDMEEMFHYILITHILNL